MKKKLGFWDIFELVGGLIPILTLCGIAVAQAILK